MDFLKYLREKTSSLPENISNGFVYFVKSTKALLIDVDNERFRINPPSDWNETDPDSPAYIENKPQLGTASSYDVAEEIDLSSKIPTSQQVYNAIRDISAEVQTTKAMVGSPYKASSLREMVDENKIYIYIGNEIGMKNGHWYYFDGNWVDGGVFNSMIVDTDKNLLVEDMAADAAATGNQINSLKVETTDIYDQLAIDGNSINDLKNETIDIYQQLSGLQEELKSLNIRSDSFFNELEVTEEGLVYGAQDGERLNGPYGPFAGGGSGGGGGGGSGDTIDAVFTAINTTTWNTTTVSYGDDIDVNFTWSSIENDVPTGQGMVTVTVNNVVKANISVDQGDITIPLKSYYNVGNNKIKVRISDQYDQGKTWIFNITTVELSITSTFDNSAPFSGTISFPYTPYGAVSKTVKFILDNKQIGTYETSVSGRQLSYTIPAQMHGQHTITVYFESEINGKTVQSNILHYEFMSISQGSTDVVITTSYVNPDQQQYSSVVIPFTVYDPNSYTSEVKIYEGSTLLSTQTVDRSQHSYTYRFDRFGTVTIRFVSGETTKSLVFRVSRLDIDVHAETQDLVLYYSAQGRSNGEDRKDIWVSGNTIANLSGFSWNSDGWQKDNDGINVLRLFDDARVVIPYKPFENDIKNTGKTIEIEFATRDVFNYESVIVSCFSDNIGFKITPQSVLFRGAQTEISTLYKDNEHIRLSIVIEKQIGYRLILVYINGIMSRAIQYASGERFSQPNPVNITIGSDDCGIDIYNIRIYDNDLNRQQILDNWISDTQIGSEMLARYNHNNVYDDYGSIKPENLPKNLPYFIIEAEELSQYKGDKKKVSGSFTDPLNPLKSFTFTGCQLNVQGTSSAVYYKKNYDLQFKYGFEMADGTHEDNYKMREHSIPFNRFVLKADVASSESANNTVLSMFYSDNNIYKPREVIANPDVRQGIEGIPAMLFWYNPTTDQTIFVSKVNFNLPKRAPQPYGYSGDMQSWEVERNNSANVKCKDDDFESTIWNEETQQYYPEWYDDFEARFPSDEWRDYSVIKEFVSFIKSTDREQATGENLPEPVTYRMNTTITVSSYLGDTSFTVVEENGNTGYKNITFTKDTPAYRLTKFRAEFPEYAELSSYIYYYLYTELLLMIDSRAKNMFIGFKGSDVNNDKIKYIDRKAVAEIYDADTAIGTNNSGVLMFNYALEDTDTVSSIISGDDSGGSEAPVFNAQDSVLFLNLRDAFVSERTEMYRNLRSGNTWSYETLETLFENHQAKWPEAVFNEDAYEKYLIPLINPVTKDEETGELIRTDRYLTMLQGSKKEQRKWWLYNRFKYMDSKYITGSSANNRINMRLFNAGTLTLTSAIDIYLGVAFGGGTTVSLQRTKANTPTEFVYNGGSSVQEMETWIYSGDMITDVGDLSGFYGNEFDFSKATRLRNLKIGSSENGYSNANLTKLNVQNSAMLETIDVRNCPRLDITIDLEGSPRLREAYFDGTIISGADFADGASLEILHLPSSISALSLFNLNRLTEFVCPSFENINRLMLSNIDNEIINPVSILQTIQANRPLVYINGLHLEMSSIQEVNNLYNLLENMKGVTRERSASGTWIYHEYDTAQLFGDITVNFYLNGDDVEDFNNKYPYVKFIPTAGSDAKIRYYNYDGSELLYTETVINGESGTYNGKPARQEDDHYTYTFSGWSLRKNSVSADPNALNNIAVNTNVYAAYQMSAKTYTITFRRRSEDGDGIESDILYVIYDAEYGTIPVYGGSEPEYKGEDTTAIYVFDKWDHEIEPVTGNTTYYAVFKDNSPQTVKYLKKTMDEYTSNVNASYIAEYGIYNMPSLTSVKTYAREIRSYGISLCNNNLKTIELANVSSVTIHPHAFENLTNLTHLIIRSTVMSYLDSDTALEGTNIYTKRGAVYVPNNLVDSYKDHSVWKYFNIFPDTAYPLSDFSTIRDSWEDIVQAVNNNIHTAKYHIGDTKYVDGIGLMEIVGIDVDNKADGSGKAALTFLSVNTVGERRPMNSNPKTVDGSTDYTAGGWKYSDLRTYLREDLFNTLPDIIRENIKPVTKITSDFVNGTLITESTPDTLWVPSVREICLGNDYETSGAIYDSKFIDTFSRIKYSVSNYADYYRLRSLSYDDGTESFTTVNGIGDLYLGYGPREQGGIVVGFCI